MDLGPSSALTSALTRDEVGSVTAAQAEWKTSRRTTTLVDLEDIIDLWEMQKRTCAGSDAQFARHLLVLHKAYCADYCDAVALQRQVQRALWAEESSNVIATSDSQVVSPIKREPEEFMQLLPTVTSRGKTKSFKSSLSTNDIEPATTEEPTKRMGTCYEPAPGSPCARPRKSNELVTRDDGTMLPLVEEHHSSTVSDLSHTRLHIIEPRRISVEDLSRPMRQLTPTPTLTTSIPLTLLPSHPSEHWLADSLPTAPVIKPSHSSTEDSLSVGHIDLCLSPRKSPLEVPSHIANINDERDSSDEETIIDSEHDIEDDSSWCSSQLKASATEKNHSCFDCGKAFHQVRDLKRHLMTHTDEKPHICTQCGKSFTREWSLKMHVVKSHTGNEPYTCSVCEQTFKNIRNMRKHMRDLHAGQGLQDLKGHMCTYCSKAFGTTRDMNRHILTHTGEKPHVCPECKKGFTQNWYLKIHMKTHLEDSPRKPDKPHLCSGCEERFKSIKSMKKHMQDIHDGEGLENLKGHLCTYCGKAFGKMRDMDRHILTHTGERPHVCANCGKGFTTNWYLKTHMKTAHSGVPPEKPFLCSQCGKSFGHFGSLKSHMMTHSGDMPYVCSYCGKGYTAALKLKAHVMIHTGEKPFLCTHCGKGFTRSDNLVSHMRIHTGESHVCIHCGKEFKSKRGLYKHARRLHPS